MIGIISDDFYTKDGNDCTDRYKLDNLSRRVNNGLFYNCVI